VECVGIASRRSGVMRQLHQNRINGDGSNAVGRNTIATGSAAMLWQSQRQQCGEQWQGDFANDGVALFHISIFRILSSILLNTSS